MEPNNHNNSTPNTQQPSTKDLISVQSADNTPHISNSTSEIINGEECSGMHECPKTQIIDVSDHNSGETDEKNRRHASKDILHTLMTTASFNTIPTESKKSISNNNNFDIIGNIPSKDPLMTSHAVTTSSLTITKSSPSISSGHIYHSITDENENVGSVMNKGTDNSKNSFISHRNIQTLVQEKNINTTNFPTYSSYKTEYLTPQQEPTPINTPYTSESSAYGKIIAHPINTEKNLFKRKNVGNDQTKSYKRVTTKNHSNQSYSRYTNENLIGKQPTVSRGTDPENVAVSDNCNFMFPNLNLPFMRQSSSPSCHVKYPSDPISSNTPVSLSNRTKEGSSHLLISPCVHDRQQKARDNLANQHRRSHSTPILLSNRPTNQSIHHMNQNVALTDMNKIQPNSMIRYDDMDGTMNHHRIISKRARVTTDIDINVYNKTTTGTLSISSIVCNPSENMEGINRSRDPSPMTSFSTSDKGYYNTTPLEEEKPVEKPQPSPHVHAFKNFVGNSKSTKYKVTSITEKVKRNKLNELQKFVLKQVFEVNMYPSKKIKEVLSTKLGLLKRVIQMWFHNRRQALASSRQNSVSKVQMSNMDGHCGDENKVDVLDRMMFFGSQVAGQHQEHQRLQTEVSCITRSLINTTEKTKITTSSSLGRKSNAHFFKNTPILDVDTEMIDQWIEVFQQKHHQ